MKYDVPARVREGANTPISNLDRYREHYANAVNDPEVFIAATDGGECAATPGVEGQEYCVRLAQGGIVAHPAIRVAVGYYVLPFFGIAAWARSAGGRLASKG